MQPRRFGGETAFVFAAAVLIALGTPGWTGASRVHRLVAASDSTAASVSVAGAARAGRSVALVASPAPAGAVYRWLVDGRTLVTRTPRLSASLSHAGPVSISVSIVRAGHVAAIAQRVLVVQRAAPRGSRLRLAGRQPRAHRGAVAAAAQTLTIRDFSFAPGSVTVPAGSTVTWVNAGPSSHTATADNGSFNTGVLTKGASASHTFTSAGTYAYICSIHPFMHGTVVVTAAASAPSSAPSSAGTPSSPARSGSGTTASAGAAGAQPAGSTLPNTGIDVVPLALAGALMLVAGAVLRRRAG